MNWKDEGSGKILGDNRIRLSVHNYRGYPKDHWFVSVYAYFPTGDSKQLKADNVDDACKEARAFLIKQLKETLTEFEKEEAK